MQKKIMNYMMWMLNKFTANCEIITEKISESFDNKLTFGDRLKIRIHITFCKFCRRYQHQLVMMHKYFEDKLKSEKQTSRSATPGLSDVSKERMKKNLRNKAN